MQIHATGLKAVFALCRGFSLSQATRQKSASNRRASTLACRRTQSPMTSRHRVRHPYPHRHGNGILPAAFVPIMERIVVRIKDDGFTTKATRQATALMIAEGALIRNMAMRS